MMGVGEERVAGPLVRFLELRAALTVQRLGIGGPELCRALTDAMDGCVAAVFAPLNGRRVAAVAVGGYGRGELCLHSDIDLMLLHGGRLPPGAVEAVFYPLWDARLKVGHAVRSVKDALVAARERLETLTALMDARLVTGDAALLDELLRGLGELLRRGRVDLSGPLAATERERRGREPFQLLEANLKEGRGGLRTLQALHWERRRHILAGTPDPFLETAAERDAHVTLLATRNAIHAAAGRPFELYAFDLRPAAAAWLGLDPDTAGRHLYAATRTVDRLARERWGDPTPRPPPRHGEGEHRLGFDARRQLTAAPSVLPPTSRKNQTGSPPLRGEGLGERSGGRGWGPLRRLARPANSEPSHQPSARIGHPSPLALAVGALGRPVGRSAFTAEEAEIIRSSAGPAWDTADRAALLRLLAAGWRGWEVFNALDELGWVGRALPEWRHVVAAPQHAPFHLHPLDVHLWRTVIELQQIVAPGSDEPWCAEAAAELGSLDDALLAAVLHDIGKGWPGDHSLIGAEAVAAFCRRARFGPALAGTVTGVVRHHLLLPTVATRRDIDDPRVVVHVADQAGDPRSLRILYLLSVADSRATGPSVWNPWKASLLRSLFARAADELARRAGTMAHSPIEDRILRELEAATAGRFEKSLVDEHIAAMPPSYLTSFDVSDLVRHLEAMVPPPEPGTVVVGVRPATPATNAIVVAEDRPGLLSAMSGVFALHNVSVLDGRFYTRADGVVLDSFHVEDALGSTIDERRWSRVRADMPRAIRSELPLEEMLREKARAYKHRVSPAPVPVRVLVDTDASDSFTVVEIHCGDRVGLLHDMARALFELGLDIRLAKIDTQGREVVDTFYVRDLDGEPVRDRARLAVIERGLRERLTAAL
jgi:[protein-PII] uridylyltransferase